MMINKNAGAKKISANSIDLKRLKMDMELA
jgi:hypothetical protein